MRLVKNAIKDISANKGSGWPPKKTLNERLKISVDTIVEYSEDKNFFKILYIKKAEILIKKYMSLVPTIIYFQKKLLKKAQ